MGSLTGKHSTSRKFSCTSVTGCLRNARHHYFRQSENEASRKKKPPRAVTSLCVVQVYRSVTPSVKKTARGLQKNCSASVADLRQKRIGHSRPAERLALELVQRPQNDTLQVFRHNLRHLKQPTENCVLSSGRGHHRVFSKGLHDHEGWKIVPRGLAQNIPSK